MHILLFCPIIHTFSTIKVFVGRRDAILHTHLNKKHYLVSFKETNIYVIIKNQSLQELLKALIIRHENYSYIMVNMFSPIAIYI